MGIERITHLLWHCVYVGVFNSFELFFLELFSSSKTLEDRTAVRIDFGRKAASLNPSVEDIQWNASLRTLI